MGTCQFFKGGSRGGACWACVATRATERIEILAKGEIFTSNTRAVSFCPLKWGGQYRSSIGLNIYSPRQEALSANCNRIPSAANQIFKVNEAAVYKTTSPLATQYWQLSRHRLKEVMSITDGYWETPENLQDFLSEF